MKDLIAALDAATTDETRLAALIALWRSGRSPRVADAIDRLAARGVGAKEVAVWLRTAKLPGSRAKTAVLNLAKNVDDPRLATLYVAWLGLGNWPAPTAKPVWTRIFEHLVALGDARTREPLRAFAAALPAFFVGVDHRAWVVAQIEATAKKIREPKADASTLTAALARIESALGKPPTPAADPKAAVEAVWNAPDDLELRRVVADALLEREDPWGEFISIQLRDNTTSKDRTRAMELEKKHGGLWLGAIGKLAVTLAWEFEHGFPVGVEVDRRRVHRRDWEAALAAPQWATIRTLKVSILETPMWWITEWVKSPATRSVRAFEIDSYKYKKKNDPALRLEREPGQPWRLVRVMRNYTSTSFKILRAFAAGLTPAERAKVAIESAPAVADRDECVAIMR